MRDTTVKNRRGQDLANADNFTLVGNTPPMTDSDRQQLAHTETLYAEYVNLAEISSLAEIVQQSDTEPVWFGAPPAGLVFG